MGNTFLKQKFLTSKWLKSSKLARLTAAPQTNARLSMAAVAPSAGALPAAPSARKSKAARAADARPDLIAAKMGAAVDHHVKARPTINASASRAAAPPVNAHLAISAAVGTASAQPTHSARRPRVSALILC